MASPGEIPFLNPPDPDYVIAIVLLWKLNGSPHTAAAAPGAQAYKLSIPGLISGIISATQSKLIAHFPGFAFEL